jgi:hypothetical protein
MPKHRNRCFKPKRKVIPEINPEDLPRIVGELSWAKERGYEFQELEEAVQRAIANDGLKEKI